MIGYKAFDENLQCRGFQFEVGTAETDAIEQLARDVGNYLYALIRGGDIDD